jgi:glycine/D-amino acid oxidase-like deaminating enzyme
MNTSDVLVIGGGLVGASVALGLARSGLKVTVLDEDDVAFRASRGNFGLVWVQSKGFTLPDYARWSLASAQSWPELSAYFAEKTGIDVELQQPGGLHLCLSQEEMDTRQQRLQGLRDVIGPQYQFEMLDHDELRKRVPLVGPDVVGATYTPMDGHTNPLKLFRALYDSAGKEGVRFQTGCGTEDISYANGIFTVKAGGQSWQAPKLVLAAGLGNNKLAPKVGLFAPVEPNRGEVLISERLRPMLAYPTNFVRQTDEGTVQIGDSHEDVGFDDGTITSVLGGIAKRGIKCFPVLAKANLVRAWAALRVMSPDGYPIYQASESHPGAFVVTCHSGVTLAANHVMRIAPWIAGGAYPDAIREFKGDRFLNTDLVFTNGH